MLTLINIILKLIPKLKIEKDLNIPYNYDIVLDASLSSDEGTLRSNISVISDPLLNFSWECPTTLRELCLQYEVPKAENKILTIKASQYSKIFLNPINDISMQFSLKLNKDKRQTQKTYALTLKKPSLVTNLNNPFIPISGTNATETALQVSTSNLNNEENSIAEIDITDFIAIEQVKFGLIDIILKVVFLNPTLTYNNFQYQWNVLHYRQQSQYLNGRNEINLRILYNDLLVGTNKIELKVTSHSSNKQYLKSYEYEKGVPPYGGNIITTPSWGYSLSTEFKFYISNWKSNSLPLIYKIKYLNANNILIDLTSGGFSSNVYISNQIPEEKIFYLEVIDNQGLNTLISFNLKVDPNKNASIDINAIKKSNLNISNQIMLYNIVQQQYKSSLANNNSNINSNQSSTSISGTSNGETGANNSVSSNLVKSAINLIDEYFKNFNNEKYLLDFDNIISLLLNITNNNFTDENSLKRLFNILDLIIENIDPLLSDLNRLNHLYIILDNIYKKASLVDGGGIFL